MSERVKSLVFAGVEPTQLGKQPDGCLPLHITLAPSFAHFGEQQQELDEALGEIASSVESFPVVGGSEDLFGRNGEYRVRRIAQPYKSLLELHWSHIALAHSYDPDVDTSYSGVPYSPHVTYKGDRGLDEGEVLQITHFYRAQKALGDTCMSRVVTAFPLAKSLMSVRDVKNNSFSYQAG